MPGMAHQEPHYGRSHHLRRCCTCLVEKPKEPTIMKLMNPPKLGCLLLGKYHTRALRELAANVERWGYDVLWLADERFFRDVYASLALCAMATHRIQLGTCVTDPYSRHP